MTDQSMAIFQRMIDAILTTPGTTSPSLRSELAQQTAQLHETGTTNTTSIRPELESYARKVALHAYRVTDNDIEQLQQNGYSEDALFEITLSVAAGVSTNCLQHGLKALEGARHASEEH